MTAAMQLKTYMPKNGTHGSHATQDVHAEEQEGR